MPHGQTPGQKQLLEFFSNLLDTILTENNSDNSNNNRNNNSNNDNSNNENYKNENDNENYENYDDYKIKQMNDYFKMIDKSKSFEGQIKLLKKHYLNEYWNRNYYYDDKELNLNIFKLKFTYISNDIDENLFKEVFGHTSVTLANKLINTTNKEENQIIANDIKKIGINFTNMMVFIIM